MTALLSLLLSATPVSPAVTPPRIARAATATVQIIQLESVTVQAEPDKPKRADRQFRQRDLMPLVEFF